MLGIKIKAAILGGVAAFIVLFAEFATGTFVQFTAETLLYEVVQAVTEGFELHVVNDLVDEGIL